MVYDIILIRALFLGTPKFHVSKNVIESLLDAQSKKYHVQLAVFSQKIIKFPRE